MKGSYIVAYTTRCNDLSILRPGFVTPKHKKVERYIWGLVPHILGMIISSRPTIYDSAKRIASRMTTLGIHQGTMVVKVDPPKSEDLKCKSDGDYRGDSKQYSWKKQEIATLYATTTTSPTLLRQYTWNLPICKKYNYHLLGACRELFCNNCKKFCRSPTIVVNPRSDTINNYFECEKVGHFHRDYPK